MEASGRDLGEIDQNGKGGDLVLKGGVGDNLVKLGDMECQPHEVGSQSVQTQG